MANSIKTFTWGAGDSASTQYTLPDHFEAADIRVYVNDVLKTQGTDYNYNTTTINFNNGSLPATDDVITVERNTQNNQRLVDFSDGSILKADTLDKDSNQIFYMAQEAYDQARVTNMASGKFYYSQVEEPTDVVAGTLWYNKSKSPNVLEIYDGSDWYPAAPVKNVQKFTQADFTTIAGDYDSLSGVNFNSSTEVYLNGVKLVKGQEYSDLGNDADYFFDYVQSKLWIDDIGADDVLEVITYSGGYSETVTQAAADIEQDATFVSNFKYDVENTYAPNFSLQNQNALDAIQAKNDVDAILSNIGNIDDYIDNADLAKNFADYTIGASFSYTNPDSGLVEQKYSSKHYADAAQQSATSSANSRDATIQHKTAALTAQQQAEDAANVSRDVLNGWVTLNNNAISTIGGRDTYLIASQNLYIEADKGVSINGVPAPSRIINLNMDATTPTFTAKGLGTIQSNQAYYYTMTRTGAGVYEFSFPIHDIYNSVGDYVVQIQNQSNSVILTTLNKQVDKFTVTAVDTTGSAVDVGDLAIFVYEF